MISTNTYSGKRTPQTRMSNGSTVVSHTETYGINVTGSADFSIEANWALQPGLSVYSKGLPLGQWLPQIAANFDNYEIQNLKFHYRAACSTLTPGLVVMGFEPNPEGTVPTTYQELRNMHSVDGSAHANLSFDVSSRARKSLLIRKLNVVNLPSYDAGRVYFATIGCEEGAKLGFIDVSYTVRLFNPQSSVNSTETVPTALYNQATPTQRWSFDSLTNGSATNCATSCYQVQNAMLASTYVTAGAPLASMGTVNYPALDLTVGNGCRFVTTASTNARGFHFQTFGRYRVSLTLGVDWEDLKLFAIMPFTRSSLAGNAWTPAVKTVYGSTDGSSVAVLPVSPHYIRGFTGVATLDPNPGTDTGFSASWEIDIANNSTGITSLGFMVGIRNYNSVSTTTANLTFRDGLGSSYVHFEYLGPIPTA